MITEHFILRADDGHLLAATRFGILPSRRVVVIAGATGVKRGYYTQYASYMAGRGCLVITFDYRGIGDSLNERLRDCRAVMHDWGEKDLVAVLGWARQNCPDAGLSVVAHSVGGQMLGLASNRNLIGSIILVGAQTGYWKLWPAPTRYALALLWHVATPVLSRIGGYMPTKFFGLGEDLPGGIAREWARWCRHPDYLARDEKERILAQFADLDRPMLAYSFDDDWLAPKAAVDDLLSWYRNARIMRRHISEEEFGVDALGHFGFFRSAFKESLWRETFNWLKQNEPLGKIEVQVDSDR